MTTDAFISINGFEPTIHFACEAAVLKPVMCE